MSNSNPATSNLIYEVDDAPPPSVALPLAAQSVALILPGIALTPLIALGAADLLDEWGNWAVFSALLISGITTAIQARPLGPFGASHILFMGTSGAFIAVSIAALLAGGLPLLGSLVFASGLIQFLLAWRLAWFKHIINPTVGGTVICLIAVTVMPIGFDMVSAVPEGYSASPYAPMITAVVTLLVTVLLNFYATGPLRLWALLIGLVVGSLVAWSLNLASLSTVETAPWIGLPEKSWPGLNTDFSMAFWSLLPSFIIVTIIGALETYGDGIAIQEVSRRRLVPADYRVVQGAVYADGLGNLLSGIAGTLPNTTYSTSVAVVEMTGVAAKRIGFLGGILLCALAFIPKLSALLQAIPIPVQGVFIIISLAVLFSHGVRLVMADGLSFDNGLVFGLSLWLGIGFQNQQLFHGLLPDMLANLLNNGMTAGGISAVILSWLVSLKSATQHKITLNLHSGELQGALDFVRDRCQAAGWRGQNLNRVVLATEEAFLHLVEQSNDRTTDAQLRVRISASQAELEFYSGASVANVEIKVNEMHVSAENEDLDLKVLKYMTDELKHHQYNNGDYLMLRIDYKAVMPEAAG